jgi:hypothetical protein
MSRASSARRDESCHKTFFVTIKDNLNELYTITGIKLRHVFEMSFWMFIKAVTRALLNDPS